jgi:hypothetical protein
MIEYGGVLVENCTNFSQYMWYEYEYTGIPPRVTIISCQDVRTIILHPLLPYQYQGWILMIILTLGILAICYGFYMIITDSPQEVLEEDSKSEINEIDLD